jgi:hypothetical protein
MENTAQALKEAQAMIATIKKERRKDKSKIKELSIHEQNFLLQHNDQYMLELENQLEAVAVPPPEPVIPGSGEEGQDAEDIQGEFGIESGPESP